MPLCLGLPGKGWFPVIDPEPVGSQPKAAQGQSTDSQSLSGLCLQTLRLGEGGRCAGPRLGGIRGLKLRQPIAGQLSFPKVSRAVLPSWSLCWD